jgi:hypothetical protein
MGPDPTGKKPLALFVSLADDDFSQKVRKIAEVSCSIEEAPNLNALPAALPATVVIVAFSSPRKITRPVENLTVLVPRIPYFIVFPDGAHIESNAEYSRISRQLIETQTTFNAVPYSDLQEVLGVAVAASTGQVDVRVNDSLSLSDSLDFEVGSFGHSLLYSEVPVVFDDALSAEQIKSTLTAIANYYRACGGVGLSIDFESQEAVTEEVGV